MDALADLEATDNRLNPRDQSHDPATSPQENKFQKAIAVWRGVDLGNLLQKLDGAASEVVAHQRDSLVQRKDLAQKTKDFRRFDDATKLVEIKGLLKAYQAFVDLLTSHGKTASSSFLQLYSALSESPDPYPLLEASVESLVISEDALPKLKADKESLEGRTNQLTTQLETSEKRLEEEHAARRNLENDWDKKMHDIESSWAAVLSEKTNNWEAKEKTYEDRTENLERLLKETKASYEVSQRLGRDDSGAQASKNAAASAELEILSSEVDKTSSRLAEVEARNEQLRMELAQSASHHQSESRTIEDDPSFLRLRSENSALLRQLDTFRYDKDAENRSWEGRLRAVERETTKIKEEREDLQAKVQKWSDYNEIRRELDLIKSIEFSAPYEDEGDHNESDAPDATTTTTTKSKEDSLEQLLLARNKKLSDELTVLRVSHRDLKTQLETLQEKLGATNVELESSRKLVSTLENDLLKMQAQAPNFSSAMSVAPSHYSRYNPSRRGHKHSGSSGGAFGSNAASTVAMDAIRAGEPVGGGSGLLPMIQAQRDRFKQKNADLEEELSKTYAIVKSLRQEIASLQKDNLNLYEKTRYVSMYNSRNDSRTSALTGGADPISATGAPSSSPSPSSILPFNRYQAAYEAQISPFAAFRGRESARAYSRMSLPERVIYSVTRVILATRASRNLFALYCLALHLVVFVTFFGPHSAAATLSPPPLPNEMAAGKGRGPNPGGGLGAARA